MLTINLYSAFCKEKLIAHWMYYGLTFYNYISMYVSQEQGRRLV
jgi:hypothetical protein